MFRIELHQQDGALVHVFEQAFDARYDEALNLTPELEFSVPAEDPKADDITLGTELWLFEDLDLVDKFRATEVKTKHTLSRQIYEVEALQIIDYLVDMQVPPTTWTDQTVNAIFTDLLALQSRYTLGTIDAVCNVTIAGEFEADWESILEVMRSVQEFSGGVLYVDPVAMTLNLREISNVGEDKGQQLRYRKNLAGVSRSIEWKSLITKLFVLGNGEAEAKRLLSELSPIKQDTEKKSDASYGYITIYYYQAHNGWTGFGNALPSHVTVYKNDVDDTAVWFQGPNGNRLACNLGDFDAGAIYKVSFNHSEHLCAANSVESWGLVEGTLSFETATGPDQLFKMGVQALEETKNPRVVYTLEAVDLSYLGSEWGFEKLKLGNRVRVTDEVLGMDFSDYIVKIARRDLAEGYKIRLDLSNRPDNLHEYLAAAARKREIAEKKTTTRIPPNLIGDGVPPEPPTNVTGHGFHAGIFVSWDKSLSEDVQAYEVYRNTIDEIPASFVFWTQATYFIDECGINQTYYYWVKAVDFEAMKSSAVACADNPLSSKQIVTEDIAAAAVQSAKIANGAVVTQKIAELAVETAKLANLAVDVNKLGSNAVIAEKIAAGAVIADKIAANAVIADKIAANAILADKIAANAVTAGKLEADLILASIIRTASTGSRIEVVGTGTNKGIILYDAANQDQIALYASGAEAGKAVAGAGNVVIDRQGIELKDMAVARGIGFTRFVYEGIQYCTFWDSIDGFSKTEDGNGSVGVGVDSCVHLQTADGTADADSRIVKMLTYHNGVRPTWDKPRRFKTTLRTMGSVFNFDAFVGQGCNDYIQDADMTDRHIGFLVNDSPTGLYATVANGSNETRVNLNITLATFTEYKLEFVFTPGVDAKFYVDDALKATISTNLPSGTTDAYWFLVAHIRSVGTYERSILLAPVYIIQEP